MNIYGLWPVNPGRSKFPFIFETLRLYLRLMRLAHTPEFWVG
jgi:hypothetical protein